MSSYRPELASATRKRGRHGRRIDRQRTERARLPPRHPRPRRRARPEAASPLGRRDPRGPARNPLPQWAGDLLELRAPLPPSVRRRRRRLGRSLRRRASGGRGAHRRVSRSARRAPTRKGALRELRDATRERDPAHLPEAEEHGEHERDGLSGPTLRAPGGVEADRARPDHARDDRRGGFRPRRHHGLLRASSSRSGTARFVQLRRALREGHDARRLRASPTSARRDE